MEVVWMPSVIALIRLSSLKILTNIAKLTSDLAQDSGRLCFLPSTAPIQHYKRGIKEPIFVKKKYGGG